MTLPKVNVSLKVKFCNQNEMNIANSLEVANLWLISHLEISFHLSLQSREEDAASEQVGEVGQDVESQQPGGSSDSQPPLDLVSPGPGAAYRGLISVVRNLL